MPDSSQSSASTSEVSQRQDATDAEAQNPAPHSTGLWQQLSSGFRARLVDHRSIVPLAVLGALTGITMGVLMVAFRYLILEQLLGGFLLDGDQEYFEGLQRWQHFAWPVAGAIVLGIVYTLLHPSLRNVGLAHVLERLNRYHGQMPWQNAIVQSFAAFITLVSGQSAGREGPAVHIGAATGSLLGQYWQLPNNSTRVLVACGAAAAIAGSFNTPLAGVIFAMEVVLMEYTITGFIPVILSAVSAAVINRVVFGDAPIIAVTAADLGSLWELPLLFGMGILLGLTAGAFIMITRQGLRLHHHPIILRFTTAGVVTGLLAMIAPQIMGIGYDTFNGVMVGGFSATMLITIACCKLLATSVSAGLGMPIGVIGPALLIGGTVGGLFAWISQYLAPDIASGTALYTLVGMGAMMGALLNAPLAALVALLELTNSPSIILPGMLTIVAATLTVSDGLGLQSIHHMMLRATGKSTRLPAILRNLQRIAAISVMNRDIVICERYISPKQLRELATGSSHCLAIEHAENHYTIINTLALNALEIEDLQQLQSNLFHDGQVDMLALPLEQKSAIKLDFQATLAQAWQLMDHKKVDSVIINEAASFYHPPYQGVIDRQRIEHHYKHSEHRY